MQQRRAGNCDVTRSRPPHRSCTHSSSPHWCRRRKKQKPFSNTLVPPPSMGIAVIHVPSIPSLVHCLSIHAYGLRGPKGLARVKQARRALLVRGLGLFAGVRGGGVALIGFMASLLMPLPPVGPASLSRNTLLHSRH